MTEQASFEQIVKESVPMTFIRVLGRPYLRTTALRCIASIFRNFFFLQWRAALLPGRIPVTGVDHPLDSKIPFLPGKVNIYLDFVAFWIRTVSFLLRHCVSPKARQGVSPKARQGVSPKARQGVSPKARQGVSPKARQGGRGVLEPVRNFIESMDGLYAFASEVYRKNLSTTERPFYISRFRFLVIHVLDPHLMCIPSLHVMVVTRTYTLFREIVQNLGEEGRFAPQAEELYRGALAITEAVLYVKQHSVNCISAAMYAMTRFDPSLFPPAEAERFVSDIFRNADTMDKGDADEIRGHILALYRRFLAAGETARDWKQPLLDFLKDINS